MNITEDITNTLRAEDHGHPPLVLSLSLGDLSLPMDSNHNRDGELMAWGGRRKYPQALLPEQIKE